MHLFSPLSQGLFRSVISFSGSAINFWANRIDEEQLSYAQKLADAVGCPLEGSKDLIGCLKTVSAEELTLVQPSLHDIFQGTSAKLPITTFSPRADKEAARPFLPKSALEMARQGEMPSYPFLTGYASQEGAFKTASLFGQDSMAFLKEFDAKPLEALKALTGNQFSHESVSKLITKKYM
jgi:carboxylesterase type B